MPLVQAQMGTGGGGGGGGGLWWGIIIDNCGVQIPLHTIMWGSRRDTRIKLRNNKTYGNGPHLCPWGGGGGGGGGRLLIGA